MAEHYSPQSLTEADLTEAKDLDRQLCEAMGRKDVDAVMACFWDHPDVVLAQNGQVHRGSDAVRAAVNALFDQHESISLEVNEVTHLPSGDGVIGVGTATYDLKPAGGPRQMVVERWSDLRRKIDGRWVYVLDHTTLIPEE
jgi:uncharacterized protein (TIGR02246 family)